MSDPIQENDSIKKKRFTNGISNYFMPIDIFLSMKLRELSFKNLWGGECFCPVCGSFFSEWKPNSRGRKIQCHVCYSRGRHRHLWWRLTGNFNLLSECTVLHFAPEPWLKKILFVLPDLKYIDADINPNKCRYPMSITNILLKDNSVDLILCNHVLEHVLDDSKAVEELSRVLRPDGVALLTVPILSKGETKTDNSANTPEKRKQAHGHPEHFRSYGLLGVRELFGKYFSFKELLPSEFAEDPLLSKCNFEDIVFLCRKLDDL